MNAREQDIDQQRDRHTVVGLFQDVQAARRAIDRLKDYGFPDEKIGVAMRDRAQQEEMREDTGTKAVQGAASGAVGGGIVGGVIGLLAGVGAIAIPGVGPIIAGGVLGSTLAGAGIGATAGGIGGALIGMGLREDEAKHFENALKSGGVLVAVEAGPQATEARRILLDAGADLGPGQDLASGRATATARDDLSDTELGRSRGSLATEVESSYNEGVGMSGSEGIDAQGRRVRGSSSDGDVVGDEELLDPEPWRGHERRYRHDPNYSGPERRVALR
jgi:hypothetical protein